MLQQARRKLESEGVVVEPELKRRRSQDVIPLEKPPSGMGRLPELPEDLKRKQVEMLRALMQGVQQTYFSV